MMPSNDFIVVMEKEYIGYPLYKAKGCKIVEPYSRFHSNVLERKAASVLSRLTNNPLIGVNRELKNSTKTFLMYDSISPEMVSYIRNNNRDARIIVYYINPVKFSYDPNEYRKNQAELWTFDDSDSEVYSMRWNPLHYFGTEIRQNEKKLRDVFFIGADKGRYDYIQDLKSRLIKAGLTADIMITPNSNSPFYDKKKYSKKLSYSLNMNYVFSSKAVLDIMQPNQVGYTMRIPETMVNHIKLITNNKMITKYKFYSPNNIFIIDQDDFDNIHDFINSSWDSSKDDYIKDLEYEYWIAQFNI